jgi:RNase H
VAAGCLHEKLIRLDEQYWSRDPYQRLSTHKTFITKANDIKSYLMGRVKLTNRMELPKPNNRVAVLEVQHELTIEGIKGRKKDYNEEELRRITLAHIHGKYPENEWLHMYTDGSAKPGEGNAGAGIYCREFEKAIPAGSNGSSYDGELKAILEALKMVAGHLKNKIVILSDSMAAIQAVASKEEVDSEVMECKIRLLRLKNERKEVALQFAW